MQILKIRKGKPIGLTKRGKEILCKQIKDWYDETALEITDEQIQYMVNQEEQKFLNFWFLIQKYGNGERR